MEDRTLAPVIRGSRQEIAGLARTIYTYNQAVIGPNPHRLRPGMILFIRFDIKDLTAGPPVSARGSREPLENGGRVQLALIQR